MIFDTWLIYVSLSADKVDIVLHRREQPIKQVNVEP